MEPPSTPDVPPQRPQCGGALRAKDSSTYEYRTVRIQQNRHQQVIFSSSTSSTSSHSASMAASSTSTKSRASNANITSNVRSIAPADIDQPYQWQQQCGGAAQFGAANASRMMMTTSMMRQNPAMTLLSPGGTTNYHQRCKL